MISPRKKLARSASFVSSPVKPTLLKNEAPKPLRNATPKRTPPLLARVGSATGPSRGTPNGKSTHKDTVPSKSKPTQTKRPRDLSDLFKVDAPAHAETPPKKRRMLGRSNTLSDLTPSTSRPRSPSPSHEATPSPSPSRAVSPASETNDEFSQETTTLPSSESLSTIPTRPSVRTYSQSRSFLVVLPPAPESATPDAAQEDEEMQDLHRESYADLRRRWRVDMSSDDGEEEGLMGPIDLKSITELRDKGENRRFLDEIGYLLEGLDPQAGLTMKRMRYINSLLLEVYVVCLTKCPKCLGDYGSHGRYRFCSKSESRRCPRPRMEYLAQFECRCQRQGRRTPR